MDLTLGSAFTTARLIREGAVALAIGGTARSPDLPDVPTFAELGFPNVNALQWHGIAVRAGGQRAILDKLYVAISEAMSEPETRGEAAQDRLFVH